MIPRVLRALSRIVFHLCRICLRPLEATVPRLYMLLYLRLLVLFGLKLTGTPRYISSQTRFDDIDRIEMGDRVVISEQVMLLTHDYSLTTAMIAIGQCPPTDVAIRKPIKIGNNVFIGLRSILLPGTEIGDNVIVGAGAVCRGQIPSGSVVVGTPARPIGKITERANAWMGTIDQACLFVD